MMKKGGLMGTQFMLVNQTKGESIGFVHMAGAKARELTGNPAQAALVTWYLLNNQGDLIQFVSDTNNEWPFKEGSRADMDSYSDVTAKYIEQLVKQGILKVEGLLYADEDCPEEIFVLNLKNCWMQANTLA
jgi:hypothetical protein